MRVHLDQRKRHLKLLAEGSPSTSRLDPLIGVVIKEEKISAESKTDARVKDYMSQPSVPYKRATAMSLEAKDMFVQYQGIDLAARFSGKVQVVGLLS